MFSERQDTPHVLHCQRLPYDILCRSYYFVFQGGKHGSKLHLRIAEVKHYKYIPSEISLTIKTIIIFTIFLQDKTSAYNNRQTLEKLRYHTGELSPPEMITLSCGVLFFLAFFLAMYVEVKAKNTVYQLISKFFYIFNK